MTCGSSFSKRAFTQTCGVLEVPHTWRRATGLVCHRPSPVCTNSAPAPIAAANGSSAKALRRAAYASTAVPAIPPAHAAMAIGCHHTGTELVGPSTTGERGA